MRFGARLQQVRQDEKKTQKRHPCPTPEYLRDRNIKRVAEWWCIGCDKAEAIMHRTPAKFHRILGWANAESEAEPIAHDVAMQKAKEKARLEQSARR